jgi:isopentenyl diphosphate isomerase/L-lactate dehydrogenase-like FMN-dependent dehydrogenase
VAKRRLPRVLFEAIESRVEDDRGRYLVVLSKHDQSVRLFDEVVSSPFGISPTGAHEPGAAKSSRITCWHAEASASEE